MTKVGQFLGEMLLAGTVTLTVFVLMWNWVCFWHQM